MVLLLLLLLGNKGTIESQVWTVLKAVLKIEELHCTRISWVEDRNDMGLKVVVAMEICVIYPIDITIESTSSLNIPQIWLITGDEIFSAHQIVVFSQVKLKKTIN